ncbi:MAG: chaperone, ATP12 [Rhodospirillales bacterium 70-18]|nr:chaperone, ATP12 [Rhodospirillales bacterium]OJY76276.1 MAG: chaperone, ATP12 [Rhodospirillales bacterium 70-18]
MKRFWDTAAVRPDGDAWQVLLDGRPVRLPGGPPLLLPTSALAEAVAAEWQAAGGAKGGEMSYADVPLTRLAGTAQERIAPDPGTVALELARYAETDLLCYRAELPPTLAARQAESWQPWLDWAAQRHGARLRVTSGVMHIAQDPAALAALAGAVATHTPHALAALGVAVPALGSLVLGLALAEGELDAAAAHSLAHLDEIVQAQLWGHDEEAASRLAQVAEDIAVAARLLALARPRPG